jgi:hypothetical protein
LGRDCLENKGVRKTDRGKLAVLSSSLLIGSQWVSRETERESERATCASEHIANLLFGELAILSWVADVRVVGGLQTDEGDVGRVAEGPELVDVEQTLGRPLLLAHGEIAEGLGGVAIFLLAGQLGEEDLRQIVHYPISRSINIASDGAAMSERS